jgi:uncharacterized ferritin-like protein (DUF455 family)
MSFLDALYRLISTPDLEEKVQGPSRLLRNKSYRNRGRNGVHAGSASLFPGRPSGIRFATPQEAGHPHDLSTMEGKGRLLHAIAQIELSAIELALDSSRSFPEAPVDYHREMLLLACEEAKHFQLLERRLKELGFFFGAFPVHGALWEQARQAQSIIERMAIVPRILEARGLDATPGLIGRFRGARDEATASILEVIYREEIGHVATGSRWFRHFAAETEENADRLFTEILRRFYDRNGRGRFVPNLEARRQAGFSESELSSLSFSRSPVFRPSSRQATDR